MIGWCPKNLIFSLGILVYRFLCDNFRNPFLDSDNCFVYIYLSFLYLYRYNTNIEALFRNFTNNLFVMSEYKNITPSKGEHEVCDKGLVEH